MPSRASKNLARNLMQGKDKGKPDSTRIMPDATSVSTRRSREAADDSLIAKSDSAMAKNDMLIPGGLYLDAKRRQNERSTVLPTMDKHGVEDIVRNLSKKK